MKFLHLQQALDQRQAEGLLRQRTTLSSDQTWLNFASNDYLGLSRNKKAALAAVASIFDYGVGSTASHLICGHKEPHQALEQELARFTGREAALTFSSGYLANLALLQTLAKKGDLVLADKLNHASLIDGMRLSAADGQRYPHGDLIALENRLKRSSQNTFVVTDGVFSMDGDLAPLPEIAGLCEKYQAILIVDDAHGFGVLGEQGQGICQHFGLSQTQVPVYMATLGKALGGYGAFVAGEKALVDYLLQFARPYIYTTAVPAMVAEANWVNLRSLTQQPDLLVRLKRNIDLFKTLAEQASLPLMPSDTAIQPIRVGDNHQLLAITEALRAQEILVGAIRPPTVPKGSARLRVTLSAAHEADAIKTLIEALAQAWASF